MKVCLATAFSFYLKAHNFHWNVEGPNFPQYHSLFEAIYSDVWGSVDAIAEHIRTLGAYAPGSFTRYHAISLVKEEQMVLTPHKMINDLIADNDTIITQLKKTCKLAESSGDVGIANFLQDRIDTHAKHGWMLKSTSKVL